MSTREIIERQVILFCLNDKATFLRYLNFLRSDDFHNEIYKDIFSKQVDQYREKQILHNKEFLIDLTKNTRLEKRLDITDIDKLKEETPKDDSKNTIFDYMKSYVRDGRVLEALTNCVLKVEKGNYTNEELERNLRQALAITDDTDFGRSVYDFDGRIKDLNKIQENAIASFSKQLNKCISRGFYPGELYVYMAAPGVGKSLMLVQEAFSALKQGKKCIYFTFELSKDRVGLRFDSLIGKKKISDVFRNIEAIKNTYSILKKAYPKGDIIIKEYPTKGASVLDINIFLDQMKIYKNFVPDIIYVDYGDIIKPEIQHKSEYEDQGEVFMALRRLAIEHNIPVITATQARRDILNKKIEKVSVGEISDSFTIARIADAIYALVQTPEDREHEQMKLKIIKNRNGMTNTELKYSVYYHNMHVQDSEIQ